MRVRPRRPYKNFGLFCWANGADTGRPYPCLGCKGRGSKSVTYYQPMFRLTRSLDVPCTACGGTGKGTKEACHKAYHEAIAGFHKEAQAYNALVNARQEALKKLTREEIQALQEIGV